MGTRVIIEGYAREAWGKDAALPTDLDVVQEVSSACSALHVVDLTAHLPVCGLHVKKRFLFN